DLLFCNRSEAEAVTGAADAEEAFARLATKVPSAIVTDGANGAFVRHGGIEDHVPAFPCQPVDLTGAGDMLAGAFLYGIPPRRPPACLAGEEGPPGGRPPPAPRHAGLLGRVPGRRIGEAIMARLRTFIAVELERSVRQRLVAVQETLERAAAGVKWVEPEN